MSKSDLQLPSSRTITAWGKAIRKLRPSRLWIRRFLLHRIEALINVCDYPPLQQLDRLVLEAFAEVAPSEHMLESLSNRLFLEPPVLRQILTHFRQANLIEHQNRLWQLTEQGEMCLKKEDPPAFSQMRRSFYFEESETDSELPRFLPLVRPFTHPVVPPDAWQFPAEHLKWCLEQPRQWKQEHGFPQEALSLVEPQKTDRAPSLEDWQRLLVDHAEECYLLLMETEKSDLQGFTVQPQGWRLNTQSPSLRLGSGWASMLPELNQHHEEGEWKQSWIHWGRSRQFPRKELEECELRLDGLQLRVATPDLLFGLLKKARSEALKGDAWLMVGNGRARQLVQVKIVKDL